MVKTRSALAALLLALAACQSIAIAGSDGYIGMTKRQLVRRLGLPAEIELRTQSGPAKEIWLYYWDDPVRGLQPVDFQFSGNTVSGHATDFDVKRIVSTE